jgi:hypothetical protein
MSNRIRVGESDLGAAVFAAAPFAAGDIILTFAGPIITFAEAVALGVNEANALQIDSVHYMDLEPPGCFVNHSCGPNSGLLRRTQLVAIRDIPAGDEIRYDYSTTMHEDHWTMSCRCRSPECRGVVKDFCSLPRDLQKHYTRLGIVQPFIVREINGA